MILFLEWYDLDRGMAHLGQGVAQLSQVLSFQADVVVTLLTEALPLAKIITCQSALAVVNTLCHGLVLSVSRLFE